MSSSSLPSSAAASGSPKGSPKPSPGATTALPLVTEPFGAAFFLTADSFAAKDARLEWRVRSRYSGAW